MSLDQGVFTALRGYLSQRDIPIFSQKRPDQPYPYAVMAVDDVRTAFMSHPLLEKTFMTLTLTICGKEPERESWHTLIEQLVRGVDGANLPLPPHRRGSVQLIKTQLEPVDGKGLLVARLSLTIRIGCHHDR